MYDVSMSKHRTQVLFDDWQYESLKSLAEREGESLGHFVREAVAEYLIRDQGKRSTRLAQIEGVGANAKASGRDHDELLYGGQ